MTQNEVVESSVQKQGKGYWQNTIWRLAATYDIIPEWWSPKRDAFFRGYWYTENFLASAIYAIANRNAAFGWELTGIEEDVSYAQQMLQFAEFGTGWQQFITKFTIDYLSQDNGSFIEVIRPAKVKIDGKTLPAIKEYYENDKAEWYTFDNGKRIHLKGKSYNIYDSPLDLPIGIAHLDSGQCQRTGDSETPVIYTDRDNKKHYMKWWQCLTFNEMPSPIEKMNNVGYSALTRLFRASHIMQSISLYNDEKVSGRFNRAIFLTNASADMINDAIAQTTQDANNAGLIRYSQPIIADTVNPTVTPAVATINLAEIPDGFNLDTMQNWYIANLALALGVDYGFLAPLPGKGLGTASQSETMAKQTKGKSSRLFMDAVSNALNFKGVLPESVQFNFAERDLDAEAQEEDAKTKRANRFKIYIETGMITPTIARQMASDNGDIDNVYVEAMGEEDITPVTTIEGDENLETQQEQADIIEEENETQENVTPTNEQIKEKQKSLFKKRTLFERIKNVARKAFRQKQIEIPETEDETLAIALETYGNELEVLVMQANNGEIDKTTFEKLLSELVITSLTAFYAEMSGLEPDEFTEQDELNLDEYVQVNLESVSKIADDIYNGRYQSTEDEPDRPLMLLTRLGLWTGNAFGLSMLAMLNNPAKQEEKLRWVLNPAKENCDTCRYLNGQVHTISEWQASGWYPKNPNLICGGYLCGCGFENVDSNVPSQGNFENAPGLKSYNQKRWVTIEGRHVLIGGTNGGGGGGGGSSSGGGGGKTFRSEEAIDEWAKENTTEWENNLTESELDAIADYSGVRYKNINQTLRGQREDFADQRSRDAVIGLDSAISKYTLQEDVVSWRGSSDGAVKGLNIGDSFTDNGFISTSFDKGVADAFVADYDGKNNPILIRVVNRSGTTGAYLGKNSLTPSEREFVLPRGTSMTLVNITQDQSTGLPVYTFENRG